ncbi:hypothetical protein Tco_0247920 [Tanacetum coccineum]
MALKVCLKGTREVPVYASRKGHCGPAVKYTFLPSLVYPERYLARSYQCSIVPSLSNSITFKTLSPSGWVDDDPPNNLFQLSTDLTFGLLLMQDGWVEYELL